MNIETGGYASDFLMEKLLASNRKITYEYVLADREDHPVSSISVSDGKISYDSNAKVMRTFSGRVKKSDMINMEKVDYRLIPYMCLDIGKDIIKWPLGKFLINPSFSGSNNRSTIHINGYDYGKIAMDDKTTARFYVPKDGVYTSYIAQIIGEDYDLLNIDVTTKIKAYEQEWGIGTSKIDIANTLLGAINYTPLHFDETGVGLSEEFIFPQLRTIERKYIVDSKSVILDSVSSESNAFDIPNKFIRYTESADSAYMIATYINNNEDDPYSVINRGRVIVDSKAVNDIASQADLNNYVQMEAINSMQRTNSMTFQTLNMPGHGYRNCLLVDISEYDIQGRYIETGWEMNLVTGGSMTHKCEKVMIL